MPETVIIETLECPYCHQVAELEVPLSGVMAWRFGQGAHVQVAFPDLSADDRERLVTGTCVPCWTRVMGPED